MKRKFRSFIIMIFCITILLSGCGKGKEIKDLSIVDALGIDIDENGIVNLTFQFYKAPIGDAQEEGKVEVYEASGETVQDAILNAEVLGNKKVYMAHNNVIVVGSETAKKGFNKFIDTFERSRDIRENVLVTIADGKASEIMKSENERGEGGQNESLKKMILNYKDNTRAYKITFLDICEYLTNKDRDFFIPVIKKSGGKDKNTIQTDGVALFKEDKMVGQMNEDDSFGLIFLRSKGTEGIVVIDNPFGQEGKISLDFIKTKSKIDIGKDKNTIKIKVECDGRVWESTASLKFTDLKTIDALEKAFQDKMQKMIEKSIKKSLFDADSDVLAIKDKLKDKNIDVKNLHNMTFEYDIKVDIVGYGLVANTISQ